MLARLRLAPGARFLAPARLPVPRQVVRCWLHHAAAPLAPVRRATTRSKPPTIASAAAARGGARVATPLLTKRVSQAAPAAPALAQATRAPLAASQRVASKSVTKAPKTPRSELNAIIASSKNKGEILLKVAQLAGLRPKPKKQKADLEEEEADELADANALAQIDLSDEAIEKEYPPEKDDGPDEIEQEIRSAARKASQYSDELGVRPGPVFFARNDPAAADAPTAKFHALCVTKREGDFVFLFDARAENLPTLQLIADKLKQLSPPEIEGDPLADFDGELDVEWKDEDDDELEEEEEEKGEEEGAEKKKKRALKLPDMKDLFSGNNSTLHQWMHPLTDAPVDFEAACQWADEESRGYAKVVINCELDHAAIAAKLDSKPDDPQVIDTGILSSIQNFLKSTSPVHQPSFAPVKPDARYHVEYHNYLDTGYRVHLIEARAENLHVVKRLLYVMKYFRTDPDYKCGWMSTPEKPLTEAEARQEMVAHGLGEVTTFDFLHGTFDEIAVKKRLARMTKDEDDPEDEAVPFNLIEKRLWFKAD